MLNSRAVLAILGKACSCYCIPKNMLCCVLAYKHLVKLHDDNRYIIEGVYFGENQMPWMIADVVSMKKGFVAELQHQMLAKEPVYVRVSDSSESCFNPFKPSGVK